MIRISKDEAVQLRKMFKDKCYIYRLNRQRSKKHHYLVSEEPHVIKALEDIREEKVYTEL